METRSAKYLDNNEPIKPKLSRSNKNRYLYDDVNNMIGYEEIENFTNYNSEFIENEIPIRTREELNVTNIFNYDDEVKEIKKEIEEENKIYDINSVLEEARKNRVLSEEDLKKRQLQNAEYSILADLNKKYLSKKEKIEEELEREGIHELIDTITSKTLAKDLNDELEDDGKDLMSDLMATSTLTSVSGVNLEEEIAKEILVEGESIDEEDDDEDKITREDGKLVNSFYTKSMDLSEQDFEFRDEIREENREKRKILILIILIVLVLIAIASVFILKEINII